MTENLHATKETIDTLVDLGDKEQLLHVAAYALCAVKDAGVSHAFFKGNDGTSMTIDIEVSEDMKEIKIWAGLNRQRCKFQQN